jgi:hypothetical protein
MDDDIVLGEEVRTDPNLDFSLLEKLGEGYELAAFMDRANCA